MATFRPSARVRLQLRLEELSDVQALELALKKSLDVSDSGDASIGATVSVEAPDVTVKRVDDELRFLFSSRRSLPPEEFNTRKEALNRERINAQRRGTKQKATNDQRLPLAIDGDVPDDRVILGHILPISVSIDRNGRRQADTASVTLDFRDAPIDPRIVRAGFIEITLGIVQPSEYELGIKGIVRDDGMPLSVVDRGNPFGPLDARTQFLGWIDEWTINSTESGDTVSISCRDVTALLTDTQLPPGVGIDLNVPIDEGVQKLLSDIPFTRGFDVAYKTPPGVVERAPIGQAPTIGDAQSKATKGRRGGRKRRARRGDEKMSVWDHIQDTCLAAGLTPLVRGATLYIFPVSSLYENRDVRQLAWGINLEELSFTRKLGGTKVPTIEVRSYDPSLGRTLWARFPVDGAGASGVVGKTERKPSRANQTGVSGANPQDEVQTYTVGGITDSEKLKAIAKQIYEEIGRQEIEGTLSTHDITSVPLPGEDEDIGDLLRLDAGDAVEIVVHVPESAKQKDKKDFATTSNLQDLEGLAVDERRRYLESIGWGPEAALKLALAQQNTNALTRFLVSNVNYDWGADGGLSISLDFTNFIVTRELA